MISNKNLRDSLRNILKAFLNKKLFSAFLILLFFVVFMVLILFRFRLWDVSLLKDTCFWFISSATIMFFNITKAKNIGFFKDMVFDNLKLVIILEYLLNFYTFSFGVEFCLLPITVFLSALYAFSELPSQQKEKNSKKVTSLFKGALVIIGLIMISYAFYKTIIGYNDLITIPNLKALLLPLVFTILTIPYFYFLALYMEYETVFVSINCFFRDREPQIKRKIKFRIILFANINLNRIKKVQGKKLSKIVYFEGNLDQNLKKLFEKPLHKRIVVSSRTKIQLFNDIEKARLLLSLNGIGNFSEWDNCFEDEFQSITNYFTIGSDYVNSPTGLQNNIAYYLMGVETYITSLELVLNLNSTNEKNEAISIFKELIIKTFNVLELGYPSISLDCIDKNTGNICENDIFCCKLDIQEYERMDVWKLIIETKLNEE